jgi:DNA-binding CsgD family transcriptional regulator/RimJ/RimL family protein N-acetyltransferase
MAGSPTTDPNRTVQCQTAHMAATDPPMTWRQGDVVVRLPGSEDIAAMTTACRDESVVRWSNVPVPYSRHLAEQWVIDHSFDDPERWWSRPTWAVEMSGAWAGTVGFHIRPFGAANLALLIAPQMAHAFAFALQSTCQWAFDTLGVDVIRWVGMVHNDVAIQAVRSAGFRVQADIHRLGYVQRGSRRDAVTADLIRGDNIAGTGLRNRFAGPALTKRETEVLKLLATGQSNREIATNLGIRENTVKNHVRGILEKLQATSRVEAVIIGAQQGLVHVGPGSPNPGNR